mgnify:CR=1 FL=1
MGISAAIVLVCSNIVISALRKVIPSKVRIPCYIVVIAGFVTIVQMLVKAYLPALNDMLGVYLPLIVVNCIILGRAEAFAGKNSVIRSAADGLGMGIGFTCALIIMGGIRELLRQAFGFPSASRNHTAYDNICFGSRRILRVRYGYGVCKPPCRKERQTESGAPFVLQLPHGGFVES